MPRRPPARVRASQPARPRPWWPSHITQIPGASGSLTAAMWRLEHRDPRLEAGDVAAAFITWRRRAFGPYRQLTACCEHFEYDYLYFGPPPRDVLEFAVHRLPRKSASELRRLLEPIDRRFFDRTLPNPFAPPGPWWTRRLRQSILD